MATEREALLLPAVRQMTPEEREKARERTGITREQLLKWLEAKGRAWLVVNLVDLVNAQVWPEGTEAVQLVLQAYEAYRQTIPTGDFEVLRDPVSGLDTNVPIYKDDRLTLTELDRAIRALIGKASEMDPKWSLENAPL